MPTIERFDAHAQEDWAIRMFAINLSDELSRCGYIVKKELPYFNAIMSAIARHPDLFRRSGYSIGEMRFSQHTHDKKGKVVSCAADFGGNVPTDEVIVSASINRAGFRSFRFFGVSKLPRAWQNTYAKRIGVIRNG